MSAEIVDLSRIRNADAQRAFDNLFTPIVESDEPVLAGCYVAAGIVQWLTLHQGLPLDGLLEYLTNAVEQERERMKRNAAGAV